VHLENRGSDAAADQSWGRLSQLRHLLANLTTAIKPGSEQGLWQSHKPGRVDYWTGAPGCTTWLASDTVQSRV
jgi:hypothetical protein